MTSITYCTGMLIPSTNQRNMVKIFNKDSNIDVITNVATRTIVSTGSTVSNINVNIFILIKYVYKYLSLSFKDKICLPSTSLQNKPTSLFSLLGWSNISRKLSIRQRLSTKPLYFFMDVVHLLHLKCSSIAPDLLNRASLSVCCRASIFSFRPHVFKIDIISSD